MLYPLVLLHCRALEERVADKELDLDPAIVLVVFSHQGYQYAWADLDGSPDPPAWFWQEGNEVPTSYGTFTEWLQEMTRQWL